MLKITIDNCHKCDLETIIDPNNSQYFWINRRDLEIETKRNWQVIFDKYKDLSTQKYRKELTPNITFQPNKIFVRNNLFEKIIKSCKTTNLEFLKVKEKLGLCLHEIICDEQEFISTSDEIFTQHDVENNQLKEENEQFRKNNVVKDATIKESIEKPKEIKSPKEDKNATDNYLNWFDRNKFKKILAIIDRIKFNYKNKIGELKYIDIRDLVNDIRNNTISEISAKKGLNKLNEIKNVEIIKYKKRTPKQKKLLNLFNNLLDTILTDKTLMSSKDENENENENDKTLIRIKELNDDLDEITDKSKSFEDQIKSKRKVENIIEYWHYDNYGD